MSHQEPNTHRTHNENITADGTPNTGSDSPTTPPYRHDQTTATTTASPTTQGNGRTTTAGAQETYPPAQPTHLTQLLDRMAQNTATGQQLPPTPATGSIISRDTTHTVEQHPPLRTSTMNNMPSQDARQYVRPPEQAIPCDNSCGSIPHTQGPPPVVPQPTGPIGLRRPLESDYVNTTGWTQEEIDKYNNELVYPSRFLHRFGHPPRVPRSTNYEEPRRRPRDSPERPFNRRRADAEPYRRRDEPGLNRSRSPYVTGDEDRAGPRFYYSREPRLNRWRSTRNASPLGEDEDLRLLNPYGDREHPRTSYRRRNRSIESNIQDDPSYRHLYVEDEDSVRRKPRSAKLNTSHGYEYQDHTSNRTSRLHEKKNIITNKIAQLKDYERIYDSIPTARERELRLGSTFSRQFNTTWIKHYQELEAALDEEITQADLLAKKQAGRLVAPKLHNGYTAPIRDIRALIGDTGKDDNTTIRRCIYFAKSQKWSYQTLALALSIGLSGAAQTSWTFLNENSDSIEEAVNRLIEQFVTSESLSNHLHERDNFTRKPEESIRAAMARYDILLQHTSILMDEPDKQGARTKGLLDMLRRLAGDSITTALNAKVASRARKGARFPYSEQLELAESLERQQTGKTSIGLHNISMRPSEGPQIQSRPRSKSPYDRQSTKEIHDRRRSKERQASGEKRTDTRDDKFNANRNVHFQEVQAKQPPRPPTPGSNITGINWESALEQSMADTKLVNTSGPVFQYIEVPRQRQPHLQLRHTRQEQEEQRLHVETTRPTTATGILQLWTTWTIRTTSSMVPTTQRETKPSEELPRQQQWLRQPSQRPALRTPTKQL